jgi:hypothetical protein
MASLIIFAFSGEILPRASNASATERGVGCWWRSAAELSGADGILASAAASLASRRACTAAISGKQGPAEHAIVNQVSTDAASPGNRPTVTFADNTRGNYPNA